jgi:hypothetical protein
MTVITMDGKLKLLITKWNRGKSVTWNAKWEESTWLGRGCFERSVQTLGAPPFLLNRRLLFEILE